jgi:trehalose 6-phosphate synthase/phosphatase
MSKQRIIAVAHFLPWICKLCPNESDPNHWEFEQRKSHIALFAGLHSLSKEYNCIYIGWIGECFHKDGITLLQESELTKERLDSLKKQIWQQKNAVPIVLNEQTAAGHYEGFCKTGNIYFIVLTTKP